MTMRAPEHLPADEPFLLSLIAGLCAQTVRDEQALAELLTLLRRLQAQRRAREAHKRRRRSRCGRSCPGQAAAGIGEDLAHPASRQPG